MWSGAPRVTERLELERQATLDGHVPRDLEAGVNSGGAQGERKLRDEKDHKLYIPSDSTIENTSKNKNVELVFSDEERDQELPDFSSFIPFLPPLSAANIKVYYATRFTIIVGIMVFGDFLAPINCSPALSDSPYLVGMGSYDITGPAADVNMMGYANAEQIASGIHFRLKARAFIVAEPNIKRVMFVNLDACMASHLVTIKVLERLKASKLSGMELNDTLGYQLSSLQALKTMNLAKNNFSGNLPYSISNLVSLEYLNLSHNSLFQEIGELFGSLSSLAELIMVQRSRKSLMTLAKAYVILAKEHDNLQLAWELSSQIRNCQRLLSEGAVSGRAITKDEAHPIISRLTLLIYKAQDSHYDISSTIVTLKNHALALEERAKAAIVQSAEFGQLAAESFPKNLHCLTVKLTEEWLRNPKHRSRSEENWNSTRLVDNKLYHFCIFSDNVLATSVVVYSTVSNANHPQQLVFHVVTDRIHFGAMSTLFLINDFKGCTVEV
ncbi:putative galacturonosyltransferase 11 [Zea mays]|uniref:Putative galacturonosyltransferase 11 n=1 Tax=Zea mays TaxID=4577 RepID=A0A3L6GAX6_MAIZE|nr:putative galacturonosyltransferase 11 [Zea mays]